MVRCRQCGLLGDLVARCCYCQTSPVVWVPTPPVSVLPVAVVVQRSSLGAPPSPLEALFHLPLLRPGRYTNFGPDIGPMFLFGPSFPQSGGRATLAQALWEAKLLPDKTPSSSVFIWLLLLGVIQLLHSTPRTVLQTSQSTGVR